MANKLKKDTPKPLTPNADGIIDIEFSEIRKKRFRFDGDDSRIVELNTSDLNTITRLEESYPKLQELAEKVTTLADDEDATMSQKLKEIDTEMRNTIDYIFDAKVSDACAGNGSMYDPLNGSLRYELVIDKLTSLYETNLKAETAKLRARTAKHTDKYTK